MFENGQGGNIVDENGNEVMDWEEEVNPHSIENLGNFAHILVKKLPDLDLKNPELPQGWKKWRDH